MAPSITRFLDQTQRRTTFGRTPLDEWSARCRDLWQHTTLKTATPPAGFEPTIAASEWPLGPATIAILTHCNFHLSRLHNVRSLCTTCKANPNQNSTRYSQNVNVNRFYRYNVRRKDIHAYNNVVNIGLGASTNTIKIKCPSCHNDKYKE